MTKKRGEDTFVSTFVHLAITLRRRLDSLSRQYVIVSSATDGLHEIATLGGVFLRRRSLVLREVRSQQKATYGERFAGACRP